MKRMLAAGAAALTLSVLAACGDATTAAAPTRDAATLTVVTGAYPLEYAISRVGGDLVRVGNLTPPGADPHDLELTPGQVGQVSDADLVVHLEHLQPALDDAVAAEAADSALEVTRVARVDLPAAPHDHDHDHDHGGDEDDHDHGPTDPHFWLDPLRMADTGDAIAERLGALDPQNAATYQANAADLRTDLTALDEDYRTGLATCTSRDLVTAHAAFGYLADRYDLDQIGVTGLSPDAEPSPRQMADVVAHVQDTGVTTVYTETLASPALAETVAREAGVRTAVLDPLEGLTADNADEDYLSIMTTNLETLRTGQGCS